jgi:hypothetical protein
MNGALAPWGLEVSSTTDACSTAEERRFSAAQEEYQRGFSPRSTSPQKGAKKLFNKNCDTPNKFPFGHNPIPASTPRDAESGQDR